MARPKSDRTPEEAAAARRETIRKSQQKRREKIAGIHLELPSDLDSRLKKAVEELKKETQQSLGVKALDQYLKRRGF